MIATKTFKIKIYLKIFLFIFVFISLIGEFSESLCQGKNDDAFLVNLYMVESFSNEALPVKVEVFNNSEYVKYAYKPKKGEEKFFNFFSIYFDGKKAESIWSGLNKDRIYPPTGSKMKPQDKMEFKINLNNIYKIPSEWRKSIIKVNADEALKNDVQYSGCIRIRRVKKGQYISLTKNPHIFLEQVDNNTNRIDVSIDFKNKFTELNNMSLLFKFKNPSKYAGAEEGPVELPVNKHSIAQSLSASFDDNSPIKRDQWNDKENITKSIIEVGESREFKINLHELFQIPDNWKKIKIKLNRFHPSIYKTNTLTLRRIETTEKKEEPENR